MIPFSPDCKIWRTEKDKVVTVADFLAASDWDGTYLHITGSQENDYFGASSLFNVTMHRDLVIKYFGLCRVFSSSLYNIGDVNVADRKHLFAWAVKNGIQDLDGLRARYEEYKYLFPRNCLYGQSRLRISV